MTPELQQKYDESCLPLIGDGSAITLEVTKKKSWRYFLEINSLCSLHCPTCTKGNQEGYDHQTGVMDEVMMGKILDKIQSENPDAIIFLYGNSEPFLHKKLPECIAAIKQRGLNAQLSTNLNYVHHLDETLAAGPDLIIISLSGFTQEIYERGHTGGKIEKVMANMRLIGAANAAIGNKISILVNFHVYDYNHHEIPLMEEFCKNLGIGFFTSIARAISMENAIQYCRSKDPEALPYELQEGRPDWNTALPPVGKTFIETMGHLRIPPDKAVDLYQQYPVSEVCPVGAGSLFTFIRHDGKTQLCACTADRRITLKDFLDTTPDELIEQRTGHAICKQCIKYRLNLYFMIADRDKWIP